MHYLKRIKSYIKCKNQLGKLLWLRVSWLYLRNLWYFHPLRRLLNAFLFFVMVLIRQYKKLQLDTGILNGVFYVGVIGKNNRRTVIKIPRLDNKYSYTLWRKIQNQENFNEYKKTLLTLSSDPILGKHFPLVRKVRRDGGYISKYIEGLNITTVRDILSSKADSVSSNELAGLKEACNELITNLEKYHAIHGHLIGDWDIHNLIFDVPSKVVVNVDLEGMYMYEPDRPQTKISRIRGELDFLSILLDMKYSTIQDEISVLKVLNVINYTTRSQVPYSGKKYHSGYHSIKLRNKHFSGQRDCAARLSTIPYDFSDKVVLDIGCNCGGMLHSLADTIRLGIGIDRDPRCVNAANLIRSLNGYSNLNFYTFDLDNEPFRLINNFILDTNVDITFLLSLCMWLKNWEAVICFTASVGNALLFESNGNKLQQKEQADVLHQCYDQINLIAPFSLDDQVQRERKLYLCYKNA